MTRHAIQLLIGVALGALAFSCSKAPQAPQPKTVDLDRQPAAGPGRPPPPAPAPPAPAPPAAAPAAATPAAATPAAKAPAAPEEPKRTPSIALHLSTPRSEAFAMPDQGKKAHVQVTAVNAMGRPYASLEEFFGARLLLVVMRSDGSWARIFRTADLSKPERSKHLFKLVFERAGAHMLSFTYDPPDGPLVTVPAYIDVNGKSKPAIALEDRSLRYVGPKTLEVALAAPEGPLKVCEPIAIATTWTRKGKTLGLAREGEGGPTVRYVAAHMGLTGLVLAQSLPDPKPEATAGPGDAGTRATLRLDRSGQYRVIATARAGKREVTALFTLSAEGEAPAAGCPPSP